MSNSLLDQLKKSGLVDGKKANKAQKAKQKQAKKQRQNRTVDEGRLLLQQQQAEKVKRDRELNLQQKNKADKKAIQAQIRQLIELNQISDYGGDMAYNFTDKKIIKSIYLSEQVHKQLSQGHLAVAKLGDNYKLIPTVVAKKISQRDEATIIQCNTPRQESEDDGYADYKVPDDLMW